MGLISSIKDIKTARDYSSAKKKFDTLKAGYEKKLAEAESKLRVAKQQEDRAEAVVDQLEKEVKLYKDQINEWNHYVPKVLEQIKTPKMGKVKTPSNSFFTKHAKF